MAQTFVDIATALEAEQQVTTAVVEDITPDGIARVVLAGDEQPRDAGTVLRFASAAAASEALLGRTVLVVMDRSSHPVIVGIVTQRLWDEADSEVHVKLPADETRSVQLDKRQVNLEASEEIRLTCGKSSLVMRRDGSVIIRGVTVISRAEQANKIRGGTVSIN